MIWTEIGLMFLLWPDLVLMRLYGESGHEAWQRFHVERGLSEIAKMYTIIQFGALVALYGIMGMVI